MYLQGAKPIDLPKLARHLPPNKRHRHQSSIARSIKSLIDSPSQSGQISSYQPYLPNSSTNNIGTSFAPNSPIPEKPLIPLRREPDDSEWDIVDDQSIRWATDYKPLASPGSRLAGTSALLFATWSDEGRKGGEKLLAIATKSNVLLYETPKGERAYKFVKVCLFRTYYLKPCTLISPLNRNSTLLFKLAVSFSFNRPYRILPRDIFPRVFRDDLTHINDLIVGLRCGLRSVARPQTPRSATALISVFSLFLIKRLCGFV